MADDKKNIPEAAPPTEAPAPAVENAAVPEQPAPEAALTDAETVMLEHEGQAALFEMGEAVPDPADAVTHAEGEKPAVDKGGVPAGTEVTPEPSAPRDATRAEKEEIVYLNLSDLHPFKKSSLWRPGQCGDAGACGVGQGSGRQSARAGASP